jgi:tRNA pseudouridine55 synthase
VIEKEKINEFDFLNGEILLINKDKDWTSFDVVNKARSIIRKKLDIKKIKVGHAGTLDPMATGLLVVCTGKMTKKINELQNDNKEYIAQITFGATTPSFDKETEIDNEFDYSDINEDMVEEAIKSFKGKQMQIPPIYSALKINGQRAYQIARKGGDVEMTPREIEIYNIELINYDLPNIRVKVNCSKGTYIRSLARDLGEKLNNGAYLTGLIRTISGNYKLSDSITINEFEQLVNKLN